MPGLDDEEWNAVVSAAREKLANDRFPLSPRLRPLRSALNKIDNPVPSPEPAPPLEGGPDVAIRRRKNAARRR